MDKVDRKQALRAYKQRPPEAGVFYLVCEASGASVLLGTMNLTGELGKLKLAQQTGDWGVFPPEMREQARIHGAQSIRLEILDRVEVKEDMDYQQVRDELELLVALWREKREA